MCPPGFHDELTRRILRFVAARAQVDYFRGIADLAWFFLAALPSSWLEGVDRGKLRLACETGLQVERDPDITGP